MLGFAAQQGSNQASAEEKEDGDAKPSGQLSGRHRVGDKDNEKRNRAQAIEGGNVEGPLHLCDFGVLTRSTVFCEEGQVLFG